MKRLLVVLILALPLFADGPGGTTSPYASRFRKWVSPDPATCTVGQVGFNITTALFKGCAVAGTWGAWYVSGGADVVVSDGGTGVSSLTAYAPIFGGTTSTGAVQSGTVGTSGQVLTSNGAGALPTFQAASSAGVTGTGTLNVIPRVTNATGPVIGDSAASDDGTTFGTGARAGLIGAPASATPAARTLSIGESSRGGTDSNVAGASGTIRPGNGTGTGGSGSILFQTAPVAASSSTANTMATRLTIDSTGLSSFAGNVSIPSTNCLQLSSNIFVSAPVSARLYAGSTCGAVDGDIRTGQFTVSDATVTVGSNAVTLGTSAVLKSNGDVGLSRLKAAWYALGSSAAGNVVGGLATSGVALAITATKTANYTTAAVDHTVLVNTTGGAFTITLSSTNAVAGQIYIIKCTATSSNAVTLSPSSGTLDGAATVTVTPVTVKEAAMVQFDGTNWWIIGSNATAL